MATSVGFLVLLGCFGLRLATSAVQVVVALNGKDDTECGICYTIDTAACNPCLTVSQATKNRFGSDGKTFANVSMRVRGGRYEEVSAARFNGSLKITGLPHPLKPIIELLFTPLDGTFIYAHENSNLSLAKMTLYFSSDLQVGYRYDFIYISAGGSAILSECNITQSLELIFGYAIVLAQDTYSFAMENCAVYGIYTVNDGSHSLLFVDGNRKLKNMFLTNTSFTKMNCAITYYMMEVVESFNVLGCVFDRLRNKSYCFTFEIILFHPRFSFQSSVFLNVNDPIGLLSPNGAGEISFSNVSFTNSTRRMISVQLNATSHFFDCRFENITQFANGAIWVYTAVADIKQCVADIKQCVFKKCCEGAVYGYNSSIAVIESIFIGSKSKNGVGMDIYGIRANITLVDSYTELKKFFNIFTYNESVVDGAFVIAADLCKTDPVTPTAKTAFAVFCPINDAPQAKGSAGGDNKIPRTVLISIIVVGVVVVVVGATVLVLALRRRNKRKDDSSTELTLEAEQGSSESM